MSSQFLSRSIGGIKTFLFSSEDFVLVQTRSQEQFLFWLIPKLPTNTSSSS
ncbi:MAG: hypothetical protein V7L21_21780 [Nostoc sp.]|uniref:hypothetical protein n=1 Tax=unclassified Nostoc TaxID=2593658 RepID=UPI0025E4D53D|nr:hypothetical protein [Nostoc sp. NMS9]MBN3941292.1 hypothetical protein [Nostoc sp. NMS9]